MCVATEREVTKLTDFIEDLLICTYLCGDEKKGKAKEISEIGECRGRGVRKEEGWNVSLR